jgi:quinate dehydrogenase
MTGPETPQRLKVYIAGAPGGHSIAPPIHDFIARKLGKAWTTQFLGLTSIQEVVRTFHSSQFGGGIVTMPWKKAIIPYLDEVDEMVSLTGACNVVTVMPDGCLRGTNVDWVGIELSLLAARGQDNATCGMIYGAGGASRAALYVLAVRLRLKTVYIVNRDDLEVAEFLEDASKYDASMKPSLIHVKTLHQARDLEVPAYIISTVPDLEARSTAEIESRAILREFVSRRQDTRGLLLDMCYHPRTTRNLKLALDHGWMTLDGVKVVAHQFKAQWKLWAGQEMPGDVQEEAFAMLESLARVDKTVTPDM